MSLNVVLLTVGWPIAKIYAFHAAGEDFPNLDMCPTAASRGGNLSGIELLDNGIRPLKKPQSCAGVSLEKPC
jgi:hypothetical protein